jgi:hypothetical protein
MLATTMLLLVGCASDPGARVSKYQIKSIGVATRVDAAAMRYGVRKDATLNEALTGMILDSMKSKLTKRLGVVMQENNIDVPSMVRSNFVHAVVDLGYQYSEKGPDATFVLGLEQYGFDDTKFFRPNAPFAIIVAKLVKSDGKVIWRGSSGNSAKEALLGNATPGSDENGQLGVKNLEDYERNLEKLCADWEIVVRKAVSDLLRAAKKAQ